jgi:hypothetical protein
LNNLEWKRTCNGNFLAQFTNTLNQAQVIEFEPGGKVIKKNNLIAYRNAGTYSKSDYCQLP